MANEITEIGQLAQYGGPQLTLLGSSLAGLVNSILIRQGTGAARTWKIFDPAKADALNTYKILNPGDVVLVNAKAVPMDFAAPAAGAAVPDTLVLVAPAAASTLFAYKVIARSSLGTPVFTLGAGAVDAQLDAGSFADLPTLNAGLLALSDAQVQAGTHQVTLRVTPTAGAAATAEIPVS